MSKNLLYTLNFNNQNYGKFTIHFMQIYCKKHNIDFLEINEKNFKYNLNGIKCFSNNFKNFIFIKLLVNNLLNKYDQILYCDLDVLIKPNSTNIFDICPIDKISGVLDIWKHKPSYLNDIINFDKMLGTNINRYKNDTYINTGMFVISKELNLLKNIEYILSQKISLTFPDQGLFYYLSKTNDVKYNLLDDKWNYHDNQENVNLKDKFFIHFTCKNKYHRIKKFLNEKLITYN